MEMWFMILFGVMGLLVIGPMLYHLYRHAAREDSLVAGAQRLGLTCVREGSAGVFMRGVYKGYPVMVGTPRDKEELGDLLARAVMREGFEALFGELRPRYRSADMIDSVSVPLYVFLQRELPRGLRVMRAGDARARPPREGLERVKLGIQSFDTMLVIEAEDAVATRALFAQPATREAVAGLMVEGHSFALDQGHLTLTVGQLPTPEALAGLLDQLVRAASLLDGVAEQPGAGLLTSFEMSST